MDEVEYNTIMDRIKSCEKEMRALNAKNIQLEREIADLKRSKTSNPDWDWDGGVGFHVPRD
jgi:cell division protein FtsB